MSALPIIGLLLLLAWLLVYGAERGLWSFAALRRLPAHTLVALSLLMVWGTLYGGTKSAPRVALAQFVTALRSGGILDASGRIAAAAAAAAVAAVADESAGIVAAASNSVAEAQATFDGLADGLTNRVYTTAYIALDLPRAEAHSHTNHNIAATIERLECVDGSNLVAWVWFSEEPAIAPQLAFDASVAEGASVRLVSITNTYPDTVEIDGVPCISYRMDVPAAMRGVPLRPNYELEFGGPSDPLIVPAGGVLVETNGVLHLPFTGWDLAHPEPWGADLAVRYAGGIAVEAVWRGTNYAGRVEL